MRFLFNIGRPFLRASEITTLTALGVELTILQFLQPARLGFGSAIAKPALLLKRNFHPETTILDGFSKKSFSLL